MDYVAELPMVAATFYKDQHGGEASQILTSYEDPSAMGQTRFSASRMYYDDQILGELYNDPNLRKCYEDSILKSDAAAAA